MASSTTSQQGLNKQRVIWSQKKFYAGQSNYSKEDFPSGFAYAQAVDFRTDPQALRIMPASLKESGSVVTDLVKWFDTVPASLVTYAYGDTGNLYSRTSAGSWSLLRSVAGSHGNGLAYFFGDDYLYYTTDTAIGRYGMLGGTPTFDDNFLASVGSVPQNTYSLATASASSQYATAADSASLSVTGNLTLEAFFNATSLPAVGSTMTLIGKWDESTNIRSYKMDILGVSGFFGDGTDGALTISSNTTQTLVDSACTGTAATQTLSATNASFTAGKPIFIVQMYGTGAGQWERNTIQSYTAGTITTQTPLRNTYVTGAQVIQIPQYTNVTVNNGFTWTAKAWTGTVGGILIFLATGTFTNNGTVSASSRGFPGASVPGFAIGSSGAGTGGASVVSSTAANGNGGGGGSPNAGTTSAGAGGGNGTVGANSTNGAGGGIAGSSDLSSIVMGGGGGSAADASGGGGAGNGGTGGGIIIPIAVTFTNNSTLVASGANGTNGNAAKTDNGGGGGAGGSILPIFQTGTLGTLTATGGTGGTGTFGGSTGGNGGTGRISAHYLTSYTAGTTNPTVIAIQDNTLVTTTTYQARLGISSNGTNSEFLTKNLSTLTTGVWNRLSITWTAASSLATFYLNALSLGTATGTLTSISNNASLLYIAADKGAAAVGNFFNGKVDDIRIWNNVQTAAQITANNLTQLTGSEGGLQAYYLLNNAATDSTANANNLTLVNTPTYSTSVPFSDSTTRLDIDQSYTTTGSTYTLATSISETSANKLPFTPTLDPQKSIDFDINARGTGDWTVTVHDLQNNVIATKTITNAEMATTGYQEFIFATPWRIVTNKSYHVHLTSTVADGIIVASSLNNLATGNFHTYYQFLVTDTAFHPIVRFLNKIVVGNERYLATWDGASYNANLIAFPPQTHVRCIGFWRQYIAIGTWQEPTSGTANIYDWNAGKIYFWDGISLTFNFQIDVPEGQVNALLGVDSDLYYFAGYKGELLLYQGGYSTESGNGKGNLARRIPILERQCYVEVNPQALTIWRGLMHFGMAANSDSTNLPRGVYSYGSWQPPYPPALSMDYPISTGNIGSSVSIGAVYPVGTTLLTSWKDNGAYGVDQVNFTNNYRSRYAVIECLIQDNNAIWHQQQLMKARADHLPLNSGEAVTVKYAIDRGNWQSTNSVTDTTTTINSGFGGTGKVTTNPVNNGRGTEYQIAVEMTTTTASSSPVLLGVSALTNTLMNEEAF